MNHDQKQTKRQFFIAVGRKLALAGLGLVGASLGYRGLFADQDTSCEVHLPCRNCFKLGQCNEQKAVQKRLEIKNSGESK